ncbi:MAG: ribose-phosphate diphosphokinase [Candidatus Thermoplasmatota archaeon]|jgi:ribose-phosphate pyrophosphokinase|uniref:ribose-phosphate diphosphokinase n=1 Tax=Ferroplasma sp. TaxID=2591003 RepID=UPI0018422EFB|nr:ribose-phosphate diphosphokinase [Ferroplasma sp.]MCL4311425.1 ribose-phosphate diphosphokinase [Candidatus Thermoplasmatota archaeon]HIH60431.1 ribose-phosphate diphosphokinase [Ferroplasma sp.]HII82491.1 ribose-phosphate diphosphokinase [Ferroplasma sp.]
MYIVPSSTAYNVSRKLASIFSCNVSGVVRKRFPDNEMYLKIIDDVNGEDVLLVGNTRSDSDIVEYLLLLDAIKEEDPKSITAVVPFFGYARQHMRYNNGEPVSSKVFTKAINQYADRIITVELHNEQTLDYSDIPFTNIKIINPIYNYFKNKNIDFVMSPDDGGYERVKLMAAKLGIPAYYIDKKRIDSTTVKMILPEEDYGDKNILLLDDIISTGGTIMKASNMLRRSGAKNIYACAIHGVFANNSNEKIEKYVNELAVTDTIETKYSNITVADEIAASLKSKISI